MTASLMPGPGPIRHVPLPASHETTLANGLRVIAVPRSGLPLVAATIVFDRGSASDPLDRVGVAAMTAALLSQGTRNRSALELGVAFDEIGARLDKSAAYDACSVAISATTPRFEQAFDMFAEVVREPAFAIDEFERVRTRSLSDLRLSYSSPSAIARLAFARAIGGESAYAHPVAGTMRSLAAMTRDDVVAFHVRVYRPERATLLIGGDISVEAAFALVQRAFGSWSIASSALDEPRRPLAPPPRMRALVIDKPDAGRTAITIGRLGITRTSADYDTGIVTSAVLSGYSGRLNQEIRVKRGLSYGAGASIAARRVSGTVAGATLVDHARALEATQVMLDTFASLASAPPTEAEMASRKASLLGSFTRSLETDDGVLGALADYALFKLPLSTLATYEARIAAVQPSAIANFAQRHIIPEVTIVLVGVTAGYVDGARAIAGDVTVYDARDLDFDSAI